MKLDLHLLCTQFTPPSFGNDQLSSLQTSLQILVDPEKNIDTEPRLG